VPALDYVALGEERAEAEAREERRLFYVAMTRARERLILSGASRLDPWRESGCPMAWIGPAVVPDIADRVAEGSGTSDTGVRFSFIGVDDVDAPTVDQVQPVAAASMAPAPDLSDAVSALPRSPVATLSYSALGEYERCGYRFYAERVLGLPAMRGMGGAGLGGARPVRADAGALAATERGVLIHALLERLDFRRPVRPTTAAVAAACSREGTRTPTASEMEAVAGLVEAFAGTELCRRLGRATQVRREQRFRFLLRDAVLITGALDVLAREPGGMLVVDYKSDRLEGSQPAEVVAAEYATQRLIYGLAVLRSGAEEVEVAHVFLERPDDPVTVSFTMAQLPELEAELATLTHGVLDRRFAVTDVPQRAVCDGCPAEGGLCSWPLSMTRREAPDQLF
jgi:RecB family exonuclease